MRAPRSTRPERGQALVLSTLFMTVVLGAAALSIDIGQMASNRRQLQNGADAAALAGAWQLPVDDTAAADDALAWALNNKLTSGEVTERSVFATNTTDDTIRVRVAREVQFTFGKVVGLGSHTVTAKATAQVVVLNGITTGQPRAFPYAVWDGNPGKHVGIGDNIIFRSNQYQQKNVDNAADCQKNKNPNCTWDITGNNFKGYFHWQNGYNLYVKPTPEAFSQGGNAFGTDEAEELVKYQQAGIPVLLPVINWAANPKGNELNFVITAFVCVDLDPIDMSGSSDWTGTIVKCAANGHYNGPTPPSVISSFVPVLID